MAIEGEVWNGSVLCKGKERYGTQKASRWCLILLKPGCYYTDAQVDIENRTLSVEH
jgi:hypothetical protein